MAVPENTISKALLRSFVPLGYLSDEQIDLLLSKAELLDLYQGQTLINIGDSKLCHLFLVRGKLTFEAESGESHQLVSGEENSYRPLAHEFPRKLTITAAQDCAVLKIDSDFLEKLLCWGQVSRCLLAEIAVDDNHQDDYLWIKKLLESKLFYKVPPMNIRDILGKFTKKEVFAGEKFITESDVGTCCYLIKKGTADVFVKSVGKEPVATVGVGAVVGEDALVTSKPRNASVIMKEDGILMKLEKQSFYELLKQPSVTTVTPGNVQGFLASGAQLLDVRTQKEFDISHCDGAMNLPLHLSYLKSALLDKDRQYITYSSSDERSQAAAFLLEQQGFKAFAMQGSVDSLSPQQIEAFKP